MASYDEEEPTVADDSVLNKYKMAATVANCVLGELIKLCQPGASLVDLCTQGDKRIQEETNSYFRKSKEMKKGIAFPTCISLNNTICHYSPLTGEEKVLELKDGDVVKIDLGAHVDGFASVVGHTLVVGASSANPVTGRKADVIVAANTAAEAMMRLLRPGNENYTATEMINKVTAEYNCRPVEGMQCHQVQKMVYDADKVIIWNPNDEQRKQIKSCEFELYDAWTIDLLISTGDAKAREDSTRTNVYKLNDNVYQLKMTASRKFYSEVNNKFIFYPFNVRSLEDLRTARLGIAECMKHDVIQPLPVLTEKEDEIVAQFKFTVLIMPNGPMRITGLPFDPSLYKTEFKPKEAEVKQLLAQAIKIKKPSSSLPTKEAATPLPKGACASTKCK